MSRCLPALVCKLAYAHDAWIVGSAAKPDAPLGTVRDFDVLVPFSNWRDAAMLIPSDAVPNTFGGWKCQSEGREVDVWPGDLGTLMAYERSHYAWHPRSGARLVKHTGGKA